MPKRFTRRTTHPRVSTKGGTVVLVKLRVPEDTWRIIRSRAALAGLTVGEYAIGLIAKSAAAKPE